MERMLEMLGVLAFLYAAYALSLKKWNYATEAGREQRRRELKAKGLSNTFYFVRAGTLFLLNFFSGGLFTFYWIYQQWKAILRGFKRLDGQPLKGGPFVRALGGFITFFGLNAVINRTCEYMRKKPAFPPWVWGSLWLAGLIGVFIAPGWMNKLTCYVLFCLPPAALQKRLNALPTDPVPPQIKPAEYAAAACGLVITLGLAVAWRVLVK